MTEMDQRLTALDRVERDLTEASDDDLRRLIGAANELHTKREAMAKIRELAKEHGLNVAIDRPALKRGRPAKNN